MSRTIMVNVPGETLIQHSEVHRARSKKTGAMVALKKIIMHHEKDGVRTELAQQHQRQHLTNLVSHHSPARDQVAQAPLACQCATAGGYGRRAPYEDQ
jgi:cell division FtsZ-interacting protein ZapD